MRKNKMIIYLTTNLVNGKKYVGQSNFVNGGYFGSGVLVTKAIKKYGKNNFKKETLIECSSQEELDEQEIFWIQVLNTLQPYGYNISVGGTSGPLGMIHSEKTKKKIRIKSLGRKCTKSAKIKISKANIGRKRPDVSIRNKITKINNEYCIGRVLSEETKKKISKSLSGKNHPNYGKYHSKETKEKMSKSSKKAWAIQKQKDK